MRAGSSTAASRALAWLSLAASLACIPVGIAVVVLGKAFLLALVACATSRVGLRLRAEAGR